MIKIKITSQIKRDISNLETAATNKNLFLQTHACKQASKTDAKKN